MPSSNISYVLFKMIKQTEHDQGKHIFKAYEEMAKFAKFGKFEKTQKDVGNGNHGKTLFMTTKIMKLSI